MLSLPAFYHYHLTLAMIAIKKTVLDNGLRIVVHEDSTTPLASCNIVYGVGSRDEDRDHTGLAHLMEHFMFTGSRNVPDYDKVLQKAGAVNNAYTSQDLTHYYVIVPANNVETVFWLESDRMLAPAFRQQSLDIQKQVVIEEFKENYLNRPYGDLAMLFNDMAYKRHPYGWLPIGKSVEQIEAMDMDIVRDFHRRFYSPCNAVLTVAGNVRFDVVAALAEKWFGDIPSGEPVPRNYPQEAVPKAAELLTVERDVPSDVLLKGWPMCRRTHPDYYAYDLLSDLLGTGQSSYLYRAFVINRRLFTDISASIMGTVDEGLFLVSGRPAEGIRIEDADGELCRFLYGRTFVNDFAHDLPKVQNRAESILLNNEIKIDDRAMNIAVGETISNAEYFLNERAHYFSVTVEQLARLATVGLTPEKSFTLYYKRG